MNPIRKVFEATWFARSIQQQVLIAISAMLVVTALVAGATAVYNGQKAVNIEIEASMDTAEGYLRELVKKIDSEGRLGDLDYLLSKEVRHLRHARVYIQTPGNPPRILKSPEILDDVSGSDDNVPDWFESLMMPQGGKDHSRLILVPHSEQSLLLKGDPDDEIAEKWRELSALTIVAMIAIAVLVGAFHFILGRILGPLVDLAGGLVALQAGERMQRLKIPRVREVADIAKKFNSLATSLDQARAENGDLYRQIQSVQEDERKEIARELHDEAGPCLFGITVSAESITNLATNFPGPTASAIERRVDEILSIATRLKRMNRALLKRLHPISIGKVPLTSLVLDLVSDFETLNPGIRFRTSIAPSDANYGERVDLTVYRATQEALTNAVRHGKARTVIVSLADRRTSPQTSELLLSISDDGVGMGRETKAGFGLSAMRERVLSAGGSMEISQLQPKGTLLSIKIPALNPIRVQSQATTTEYRTAS